MHNTYQTGIELGRMMNPITIVMIPKIPVAMHIALTNSGATCPMNIEVASAQRNTRNKTIVEEKTSLLSLPNRPVIPLTIRATIRESMRDTGTLTRAWLRR